MRDGLVGFTGTVGKSILDAVDGIEALYNSSNIEEIRGESFRTLYIAGIAADKWLANSSPDEDAAKIDGLIGHLSSARASKAVLISTIDVAYFPDEPYAINRRRAEEQVREIFDDVHVIRLPGLVGKHIKKNFIYDCKHLAPRFFKGELPAQELSEYYEQDGGIYKLTHHDERLDEILKERNLTSLRFTSKGSVYQFFQLSRIKEAMSIAAGNGIEVLDITSEPVSVEEVCHHEGIDTSLLGDGPSVKYDRQFGYCMSSKAEVLDAIHEYLEG